MPRRIYIVDDHPIVRRGMRQLFEHESGFCVCGEAGNVAEALLSAPALAPDLIVSDLSMDGMGGLELARQLAVHHPDVPVLIVSMHDEALYAQRALAAGARGYVMKRQSDDEVIRAAQEVLEGRIYVSNTIRQQMEANQLPGQPAAAPLDALSDREMDVFLLLGQGFAPRHIAERLNLSVSTIEVHRERIKQKLNLASSPLLVRYAVRWCKDRELS